MKLFWGTGGFRARISETAFEAGSTSSEECIVKGNDWRELYRDTLLEADPEKLDARVDAAQEAIRARDSIDGDIPGDERIARQEAVNTLTMLKPERE